MFGGATEQQLAGLSPLQRELKIVLPGEAHGTEQLQAVPEHHRLALPAAALAIADARRRRGSSAEMVSAAKYDSARARSVATCMSTALCWTAWNEPMATPNC